MRTSYCTLICKSTLRIRYRFARKVTYYVAYPALYTIILELVQISHIKMTGGASQKILKIFKPSVSLCHMSVDSAALHATNLLIK